MKTNIAHRVALTATFGFFACGGDAPTEQKPTTTITLGAVIDQTSTAAFSPWPGAARLAVAQLNEGLQKAGSGIRLSIVLNDTQQSDKVTVMRAIDLVKNQGAKAIITDTSKNGIEVTKLMYDADAANDINVPVLCATCTAPAMNSPMATGTDQIDTDTLRDAKNWNFRTCNRATEQNSVLKRVILTRGNKGDVNGDGKVKIAVLALDDASGHGFIKATQGLFATDNPSIIIEKVVIKGANLDLNDTAFFDGLAAKLVDGNSDCIQDPMNANACLPGVMGDGMPDALMENLNPGYNIAVSQGLARANNTITFFHAHAFRANQTADILRGAVNGQQGVSAALIDDATSGPTFAADLRAATGRGPSVLDSAVYDAVAVLGLATIKATQGMANPADVTGEQIRDALQQINEKDGELIRTGGAEYAKAAQKLAAGGKINYDGASGPVDFDAHGNVWVKLSLYQGVMGAFVDMQKFDCVKDSNCPPIAQ